MMSRVGYADMIDLAQQKTFSFYANSDSMNYKIKTRDEHYRSPGPKRILAVDGGGLRGVFSLALLKRIENILKTRYGDGFRLSHYFDLMAGTSTGSLIASSLALGMTVDQVTSNYNALGNKVFRKSFFREGLIRPKFAKKDMIDALRQTLGTDTTMGSNRIQCGLLIMTKRRDTGSPWPVSNNPDGAYFAGDPEQTYIPNRNYLLWRIVRASTAAPAFFRSETIEIAHQPGLPPVKGKFVDGGVSAHNNPALQALMFATLSGYKVNWPMGADQLMLVSIGTGLKNPGQGNKGFEGENAIKSLIHMMDDCNDLVQTLLQWMSVSPNARKIDSEIGDLNNDLIAGHPLLTYMRYNTRLNRKNLKRELGIRLDTAASKKLSKVDAAENMPVLAEIGKIAAEQLIAEDHFPARFDLFGH